MHKSYTHAQKGLQYLLVRHLTMCTLQVTLQQISLQDGDTGLILAATGGHAATVELLLDHGAVVGIQDEVTMCHD